MSQNSAFKIGEGKVVLLALVGGMATFAILLFVISGGAVRHTEIFLPEKTEVTVAFRNIHGETKVVGIKGITQVNPTILMRTGDFAMELTVINEDGEPHALYIDGLDISTRFLQTGQSEMLTFYSEGEATYNYYDYGNDEPLGQVKAVKVSIFE